MSRGLLSSRLVPLDVHGPAGPLEALLQEHEARDHAIVAVVCHPHPLYGGTMHNKVAHRAAAVLRFNFRGAGKSAGRHDGGDGEVEDARAALTFLAGRYPNARRWLAGFSFGAWIASRLAASGPGIERLILIAPPVTRQDFGALRTLAVPKLVLQGLDDDVCPPAALREQFAGWAEPKALAEIPGATHFFDRQLAELARAVEEGLGPVIGAPTS